MSVKWLPKLFKKTSTGADQYWQVGTEDNAIVSRWGQVGGAEQTTRDVIAKGKNIGKKNETTPTEQAKLEAQSLWEKKLKKGYVKTLEDARAGKIDDCIEGGVFPMLAHKFSEQGHKIVYPAYAQPKFDGHRCIAVLAGGKASLWTRTRKPITGLPHLIKDLEAWSARVNRPDIVLDGELYNHDYRSNFEELSHFIRSETPEPGCEVVQYHIYDVADNTLSFVDRHAILAAFSLGGALVAVETIAVADEDELMLAFERFLAQGYEGAMARNMAGLYVNKRSYDLQKIKEFEDAEFKVVRVEEGRGSMAGHAIFICETNGDPRMAPGATFGAKMKGKREDLKKYFEDPALAVARLLTVRFQGVTNKKRVPRFPVAWRFQVAL